MRVLAIPGSLRAGSYNATLLRAAAQEAPAGVEVVFWDRLGEIPLYDADVDARETPAAVADLKSAIAAADALLIATPEYNHSIPGVLKNALDWVSRPVAEMPTRGKPAAVIGASTGMFGAVWAQAETRKVLGALGARVVDEELPLPSAAETIGPGGEHVSDELRARLRDHLAQLLALAAPETLAA